MENNSENIARKARLLAFAHILFGFLLFCFAVAERALELWLSDVCFGIWIGIWMCITGSVGVPGTSRDKTATQRVLAGVFMGFSITSAFLGVLIVVFYSMVIGDEVGYYRGDYDTRMAIGAVILALGIAEFIIGVWASLCCFLMKPCTPCTCCVVTQPPGRQPLVYPSNCDFTSDGYVVVQGPDGVPKLIPVQSGSTVFVVQTSVAHRGQPPRILVPTTEVQAGDLPQPGFVPMAVPVQAVDCAFIVQSPLSQSE